VPRFFGYLRDVLPRYPEFDGLRALIDDRVLPAMAAQAGSP
jgi:aminoglycoside/choline kinase family phosphotransferase